MDVWATSLVLLVVLLTSAITLFNRVSVSQPKCAAQASYNEKKKKKKASREPNLELWRLFHQDSVPIVPIRSKIANETSSIVRKKTLVLDLNETLICCVGYSACLLLPDKPHGPIEYLHELGDLAIIRRPGLSSFIDFVSKHFHLALFDYFARKFPDFFYNYIALIILKLIYKFPLPIDQEEFFLLSLIEEDFHKYSHY